MMKKITLIVIILCLIVSCGKKSDPKYKDSKKQTIFKNTHKIFT